MDISTSLNKLLKEFALVYNDFLHVVHPVCHVDNFLFYEPVGHQNLNSFLIMEIFKILFVYSKVFKLIHHFNINLVHVNDILFFIFFLNV